MRRDSRTCPAWSILLVPAGYLLPGTVGPASQRRFRPLLVQPRGIAWCLHGGGDRPPAGRRDPDPDATSATRRSREAAKRLRPPLTGIPVSAILLRQRLPVGRGPGLPDVAGRP